MRVKDFLKRQIVALSIGVSRVQENVLSQGGIKLGGDKNQEQKHNQGTLADSLLRGELTEEVKKLRWRNYKVLRQSEQIKLNNFTYNKDGDIDGYTKNTANHSSILDKIKVDQHDEYPLEMVVCNADIVDGINDRLNKMGNIGELVSSNDYFATYKTTKPLIIVRASMPKFDIERYTNKMNIRKINDTEKLLEFYISKYPDEDNPTSKNFLNNIKKLMTNGPRGFDFLELKEVGFISDKTLGSNDFLCYGYKDISYDKTIEFDGFYVIKFKASIEIDGEDALTKFIHEGLDEDYNNNVGKKTIYNDNRNT